MTNGVKRMCDHPGCGVWGVAAIRGERKDGSVAVRKVLCQVHLDELVAEADRRQIGVTDER